MKVILLLVFLVLPLRAQESGQSKIEQNLYYRSLVAALSARAQDARHASANDPLHQVIIVKDDQLNVGFPGRVGDVDIEYLTANDLQRRFRSLNHAIPVFEMRPVVNEGERLIVSFTRYWFSATKRTNSFALEGGYRVVLRYDCRQKNFVVESTKLWGV